MDSSVMNNLVNKSMLNDRRGRGRVGALKLQPLRLMLCVLVLSCSGHADIHRCWCSYK